MTKSISVAGLRARLAAVLDAVRDGDTYAITRHGTAVAFIVPPSVLAKVERADRLAGQLAVAEERLSVAEAEKLAAQMTLNDTVVRLRSAEAKAGELAEEVDNLRDLTDGRSPAAKRAAARRR
ncbi:type II toxin-antitoxin system Phd/YefM family antitoxin [Streptomyces sp. NBC_01314]|uniref:type II toxin-antitoxin system Phd/YefM family antitoxin n=1 Tax=Streptomyces sp. NBC_01314 TaxID=2903821 RepID=UPI00308F4952|nr:type II toxin-antitoxin system prevent-host-death family antitoxin [Streptomyces sp. NBC_01314]